MTRHIPALLHRNSRRPSFSKDLSAPAARRSGLELLEERALLSATPTGSLLAQYSEAEASSRAALVSAAALLDQAPTVDLSAALDASAATLSGSAIRFTVQSLSSAPGDSYDAALKTQRTWLDEWSSFYIDVWAYADGAPVVSVAANFTCGASCFALTDVEAAEGYSIDYSTNAGTTSVVATGTGTDDPFEWTLVARMKYAPVVGQGVPTSEDGVLAPVDADFSAEPASQTINGAVVESVSTPNPNLYPFLFDADESGVINTNDLGYFLTYVGQNVEDIAFPKYRVLDFDHNGIINTNDLAFFLQYLGVSAADRLDSGYRAEPTPVDNVVALDAPDVVLTSSGKDYITVSWDSVPNAAQYSVAYKLASDATWITCDAGPDLRYAITGLQADSEYNVRVVARGSGGRYVDSDWSDSVVVATKDASFFSSTEYDALRQRYDDFSLPESFADVNIVVPTDWTAQALVDAIEVARSTPVDDVILLDPEKYSDALLDLSDVTITIDVDYETSGMISIVSRGVDRAQIKANYNDVTFDAVAGLTQFGGFDFVDVNPYVSVSQATMTSALGFATTAVNVQNVGAYTWSGVSVADAAQNFALAQKPAVSATPGVNDYALLFIGGANANYNYESYYDTLRDYYYELVEDFHLDPTKIYILYADGDVTGKSKNLNLKDAEHPRLTTSNMTFATSVGTTIRAATGANLTSTLGEIANLMTPDSHLLFWTCDHGSGTGAFDESGKLVNPNAPNDDYDYLCGWPYAITGTTVRDALFQIKQGYVTCVFTQCFSGGILDDIFDPATGKLRSVSNGYANGYDGSAHFTGGAAANHYETSWMLVYTGMHEYEGYAQSFANAMRNCSTGVDAFTYTEQNDPFSRAKTETYAPNQGALVYQMEHPWHVGEPFSIFSDFKQSAPTITSHSETPDSISLTWSAVQGATSYTLEYAVGGSTDVKTVKNISTNSYTVKGLNPETNYVFKVKANDSPYSTPACVWTQPDVRETPSTVVTTALDVVDVHDGLISLREALGYAASGATITFAKSLKGKTIALTRGQLSTSKTLTIDASNLWDATTSAPGLTISGEGKSRILYVGQGADVEINGITFTNGLEELDLIEEWVVDEPAYEYEEYDHTEIIDGVEQDILRWVWVDEVGHYEYYYDYWNSNAYGGAIYNNGATLSLNNCVISDNEAKSGGGALYSWGGETTLVNCAITNNSANILDADPMYFDGGVCGGAIYNSGGTFSLDNCVISGNVADYYGGAIYNDGGTLSLDNCAISDNDAAWEGCVYAYSGEVSLTSCFITDNGDAGIFLGTEAALVATNSLVAGNEGGLDFYGGANATLCNCTITDNGYGVFLNGTAVLNAYNTIIVNHSSSSNYADVYLNGGAVANAYNTLSSYADWTDGENNFVYDASKPLFTNATSGDYTLARGSVAIDAGNADYVPGGVSTDLLGNPRVVGVGVDLGAYECPKTWETSSTVVTTELDVVNPYDGLISLREALDYADSGATITFANSLKGKTIELASELGQLEADKSIMIDASNLWNATTSEPGLTISGQGKSRILYVDGGDFYWNEEQGEYVADIVAEILINGVTFANGYAPEGDGSHYDDGCGGAIYNDCGALSLNNCVICDCYAEHGGAIYSEGGETTLVNCTITNNIAGSQGGVFSWGTLTATNCLVAGNSAPYGAGLVVADGSTTLYNCTVVGNTANGYYYDEGDYVDGVGGGVVVGSFYFTAYNSIIVGNSATDGGDDVYFIDYDDGGDEQTGRRVSAYNTLSSYTDWPEGEHNLTYDASKPLFTNAASGDYTLAENSQAIDKGDSQNVTTSVDLAGNPRIVGASVDLGAYEYHLPPEARSLVVTTDLDVVDAYDGLISLREALEHYANPGDTITFANSLKGKTIALNPDFGELYVSNPVTIDASNFLDAATSAPGLTISGQGASRILIIEGQGNVEVVINGIMLTDGYSPYSGGGAVYSWDATLTLNNCVIANNEAAYGGAVFSYYGETTLANCAVTNNIASYGAEGGGEGGAFFSGSATLSLVNCTINDNEAAYGGAVYSYYGETTLANCTLTNNTASTYEYEYDDGDVSQYGGGYGGALYSRYSTLSLNNCEISNNEAEYCGGAAYSEEGETTLANCVVTNNSTSVDGYGGAFYNFDSTMSLDNCSICDNAAGFNGGGVCSFSGETTLANCTVTNNTASGSGEGMGGAIYSDGAPLLLVNCSICDNKAEYESGGVYSCGETTLTNCLVAGNSASSDAGLALSENATLYNCTIVGNTAEYVGGVRFDGDVLNIYNTVIVGNSASSDDSEDDVYLFNSDFYSSVANAYNTLSSYTSWTTGKNNLTYDASKPLFANAASGDYTLAENSQAIDKGNNQNGTTSADLAGNLRIFGGTVDLGAYEYCFAPGSVNSETLSSPVKPRETAKKGTSIAVAWNAVSKASGYKLAWKRKTDSAYSYVTLSPSTTSYTLTGLDDGTTYYWKVQALGDGVYYADSAYTAARTAATLKPETPSTVVTTEDDLVDPYDRLISLREALDYAEPGATIAFANSLQGKTIALDSELGQLTTSKSITIDASRLSDATTSAPGLTISGQGKSRILYLDGNINVEINGIALTNGYASSGGAVYVSGSAAVFTAINCLVAGNNCEYYGGAFELYGSATLYNCTIAGNTSNRYGGGFDLSGSAVLNAYNSIIAGNSATTSGDDVYRSYYGNVVANAYNTLSSFSSWTSGSNNLTYNASRPLFTNAESGDYTLAKNSQAINKGNNQYATESVDLAGNPRIFGERVDLGAYESQTESETPSTIVTTANDVVDLYDGKISLREALEYADSGDTITFANSLKGKTIALDLNLGELTIAQSITIDASNFLVATSSAPGITISGQDASRILRLKENVDVEINGITLTNGYVNGYGGAIYNDGAMLSLKNCVISDNKASYNGGGIYSNYGEITLVNCTLTNNNTSLGTFHEGGAICGYHATISLDNCMIRDNKASNGGGLAFYSGETTIVNCTIASNTAALDSASNDYPYGGGIYAAGETKLSLENCLISDNEAMYGGGVNCNWGEVTLINCAITSNMAKYAGAVEVNSSSVLTATNCLIAGNSASSRGGGLLIWGTVNFYNCMVADNTANYDVGGVLLSETAVLNTYNSIIAGNSAPEDAEVYLYSYDGSSAVANAYNTLSSFTNWTSGANNLTYNASKPLFTNAASGDYTLAKNSQAINKGNNHVTENVDLAGKTRIVGGTVDLGAYEYQSASSALFDEDAELFDETEDSLDLIAASLLERR